jgi:hypothetical protein
MCRRAGTQLAFTVFAAAKGKDETAGDTGVSKENAARNCAFQETLKQISMDLLGVDTKNWFDLGCHMTAGMA